MTKKSCLVMAMALSFSTMAAPSMASEDPAVQQMIQREETLNDMCRGGSGDNPDTQKACDLRDVLVTQLEAKGWCYGHGDQPMAERKWEKCQRAQSTPSMMPRGIEPTMEIFIENPLQPVFHGSTNLPDGSELILTLSRTQSSYMAQDKVKVINGHFTTTQFSQSNRPLNPGQYTIEVSMSLAQLQPESVQAVIGSDGKRMFGRWVTKGPFGDNEFDYKTDRQIGGPPDAKLDAAARAQALVELNRWMEKSCAESVDFANAAVRSGSVSGPEILGAERQHRITECLSGRH